LPSIAVFWTNAYPLWLFSCLSCEYRTLALFLPRDEIDTAEAYAPLTPRHMWNLATVDQIVELALGAAEKDGRFFDPHLLMQVVDCGRPAGGSKGSLKRTLSRPCSVSIYRPTSVHRRSP
jgi:hypothetical protein